MNGAVRDRKRANRQGEIEVSVRIDEAERAHRRAAADRFERSDQIERGDLRTAGDGAAGKHSAEQVGQRDARSQLALDGRDEMRDTGELPLREELGPVHAAGSRHP